MVFAGWTCSSYPVLFQNYPMLSSNEQKSLGQVPSKAHYPRNCHLEYHYCLYHTHFLHYYAIIIFIASTLLKKLEINKIHCTWKYQLILHLRTRFNVELRNTSFQWNLLPRALYRPFILFFLCFVLFFVFFCLFVQFFYVSLFVCLLYAFSMQVI